MPIVLAFIPVLGLLDLYSHHFLVAMVAGWLLLWGLYSQLLDLGCPVAMVFSLAAGAPCGEVQRVGKMWHPQADDGRGTSWEGDARPGLVPRVATTVGCTL